MEKDLQLMEEEKEYSVGKEVLIVFLVGFVVGLIMLVVSVGLVEIFK